MSDELQIRSLMRTDLPELLRLMEGIVTYERGTRFRLTEGELLRRGFSDRPEFGAFVADRGDGRLGGMAVHYEIPFMHTLQPLLMMKWLFVDPDFAQRRRWPAIDAAHGTSRAGKRAMTNSAGSC